MTAFTDVMFVILAVWLVVFVLTLGWLVWATRRVDRWSAEDRRETHRRLAR